MIRFVSRLSIALAVLLLATAPARAALRAPLVLAAASLQESLSEAASAWAAKGHPHPVLSFAGSSALARQIEAGAPADMFISADEDWMNAVAARKLIRPASRADFLHNGLVLVAPAASRLQLRIGPGFPLARALGSSRLAMADPGAVPAGKYGKAALASLGVWPSVADHIASAQNVRAALALVSRGGAPLGVVYATDARAEPGVRVVGRFPPGSYPAITYPLAILAASTNPEIEGFRRFLLSPEGKAIFRRFGFGTE